MSSVGAYKHHSDFGCDRAAAAVLARYGLQKVSELEHHAAEPLRELYKLLTSEGVDRRDIVAAAGRILGAP